MSQEITKVYVNEQAIIALNDMLPTGSIVVSESAKLGRWHRALKVTGIMRNGQGGILVDTILIDTYYQRSFSWKHLQIRWTTVNTNGNSSNGNIAGPIPQMLPEYFSGLSITLSICIFGQNRINRENRKSLDRPPAKIIGL